MNFLKSVYFLDILFASKDSIEQFIIDTGAPFGIVSLHKANGRYHLSSITNGEQSIASFTKKISLTKQKPLGISVGGDASLGNIVCE